MSLTSNPNISPNQNRFIKACNNSLWLSPLRAIYCEDTRSLIISDIHLGKTAHFRKHGLPVTAEIMQADLQRLAKLIVEFEPVRLVVVGDMFHHNHNSDIAGFGVWRKAFHHLEIKLVVGNHDRLTIDHYSALDIHCVPHLEENGIKYVHEMPKREQDKFYISGHIHPGVALSGRARQSLRMPCFIVTNDHIILPAFSEFTGLDTWQSHSPETKIYAIAHQELICV